MNSFIFCISFLFLIILGVGECKTPPTIPCSFIADVNIFDDNQLTGSFKYYSIDKKGYAMVGILPQGYPGNSTTIFRVPNKLIDIEPFSTYRVCAIRPTDISMFCIVFPPNSQLIQESQACPLNNDVLCDHWRFSEYDMIYDVYVHSDGNIVERVEIHGSYYQRRFDLVSFSTAVPPDSVLEIPADQPCADYMNSEKSTQDSNPFTIGLEKRGRDRLSDVLVNDPMRMEWLKKKLGPNPQWNVGASPYFDGLTHSDVKKMFQKPTHSVFEGALKNKQNKAVIRTPLTVANDIPASFDAREKWPLCIIGNVRDQHPCQSCWAFGTTGELADRICIETNMNKVITLSPQFLMNCYSGHKGGCNRGEYHDIVHRDLCEVGVPLDSCMPYQNKDVECTRECVDGSNMTTYKFKYIYDMYKPFDVDYTVRAIQTEIMKNGPVAAGFYVFEDFMNYAGGIYSRTPGMRFLGGHIIKIIGWGEENGIPYWLIVNSWGTQWGENGLVRFIRGKNDCSIEEEAIAGIPDI